MRTVLVSQGLLRCVLQKRIVPTPKFQGRQKVSHHRYSAQFRPTSHNEKSQNVNRDSSLSMHLVIRICSTMGGRGISVLETIA